MQRSRPTQIFQWFLRYGETDEELDLVNTDPTKIQFAAGSCLFTSSLPERCDVELSDGLGDAEAKLRAASTFIPIIVPDSFAAFAGWVTRWSSCPICHSWLETTWLSSAPVFGERWGFFVAWVSGFFFAQVPGPCASGHPSLDKPAPQIHLCHTTCPAQATGTACPAKGPFRPSTSTAFLCPHPTSHLCPTTGLSASRRSLSPDFRTLQSYWG